MLHNSSLTQVVQRALIKPDPLPFRCLVSKRFSLCESEFGNISIKKSNWIRTFDFNRRASDASLTLRKRIKPEAELQRAVEF